MTVPYTTVYSENFVDANGAEWRSGEWTQLTRVGTWNTTIQSNKGYISPAVSGSVPSSGTTLPFTAMKWKDDNIADFELSASMSWGDYVYPGVFFCWDGNINSPNGYFIGLNKQNIAQSTINVSLFFCVNGVMQLLATSSSYSTSTVPMRIRIRFTSAYAASGNSAISTNRIDFRVWDEDLGESGTWTTWNHADGSVWPGGRTSGAIGLASWDGANTNSFDYQTTSNSVSFDNFDLKRIGSSTGTVATGVPTATLLASGTSTTDGTSFTTASISPTLGRTWLAFIMHSNSASQAPTLTGAGLLWTSLTAVIYAAGARRMSVWQGTGTPTAGALTYSLSAGNTMTGFIYGIVEITGAASGTSTTLPTPNLQPIFASTSFGPTNTNTASIAITSGNAFPDVAPYALLIAAFGANISTSGNQFTPTPPATEFFDLAISTPTANMCLMWSNTSASSTLTTTLSSSQSCGGVAVMVQAGHQYEPFDGMAAGTGFVG